MSSQFVFVCSLICVCVFFITNIESQQICPSVTPVLPAPIAPILSNTFRVRVEANYMHRNVTSELEMFYDYNQRKAALIMYSLNIKSHLIYDYNTLEVFAVESMANQFEAPLKCITKPLLTTPELSAFFGYTVLNNTYYPAIPAEVLHFNNVPQTYIGTSEVRGMPVDRWSSCQYWDAVQSNVSVIFSFTKQDYSYPDISQPYNRVPLRAEIKGVFKDNNILKPFNTIYDFYQYSSVLGRNELRNFETPAGVFCADRKPTIPTPKISQRYSYSEEIVQNEAILNLKRVNYDSLFQLVRYDIRSNIFEPTTFFVKDPLTIIHDYNVGVAVGINRNLGNCSFRSLDNTTFDEDANATQTMIGQGLGFSVKLKNPLSFLHLDSEYIYTGQRMNNGKLVDTYIGYREDIYGNSNENILLPSIHEYSFLAAGWSESTGDQTEFQVPVSLNQNIPALDVKASFNYYNFDTASQDLRYFDISSCFNKEERVDFYLTFPYTGIVTYADLKGDIARFIEQFTYFAFAKELAEPPIRFAPPKVTVSEDGNMYISSSVLDSPTPIALFTKLESKYLKNPSIAYSTVKNAEECAQFCNDLSNPSCLSFDYCSFAGTNFCYANDAHISQGNASSTIDTLCDHYSRSSIDYLRLKPTADIWLQLQNSVSLGLFQIYVPMSTSLGFKNVTLIAKQARISTDGNRFGATELLAPYTKVFENSKFANSKDRLYIGQSLDECARSCTREQTFPCESFDYCEISGQCRVSKAAADNKNEIVADLSCDVYQRDPLFHYQEYPYQVTVNLNDIKITNTPTSSACAKQCDTTKLLHCRSFNFCSSTNTCYLSEHHTTDSQQDSPPNNLVCTHFSRNYLKDFSYRSTANISLIDSDLSYTGMGIEACSLTCVAADGFNCQRFDYCPLSRTCLLYNTTLPSKPVDSFTNKPFDACDSYYREYFYLTSQTVNFNQTVEKPDDSTDKSETTLAVLATIFSILSAVGGIILAIFVLPKYVPLFK